MIKNVGIITMTGNKNYGNKLQNYALQEVLRKYKLSVDTIWNKNINGLYRIKRLIKVLLKKNVTTADYKREKMFEKFNKLISCYTVNKNNIQELDNKYDLYMIGSDQIWNPNVINSYLGIRILDNKSSKASYAASFGVSEITANYQKTLKEKFTINNIANISVREDSGKEIIEKYSNRKDVEVLVDPTMLLTSDEWNDLAIKPKQIKKYGIKKYILNYFLGDLSDDKKNEIERIAKENECSIINLMDKNDPFYVNGPSEFLWLEKNAFLICTDSFHSSVFALLFDRPFIIFDRDDKTKENMSSRLDTLLSKFCLINRKYNNKKIMFCNLNHDYSKAYTILNEERKKSEEFINRVLSNDL